MKGHIHISSTEATPIGVYEMRTSTKMWVFKVNHKTGVLDLEMLLLILHDLKIKGISQIINYNIFGYEEIILADNYIN